MSRRSPVTAGRGDLAAKARKISKALAAKRDDERRKEREREPAPLRDTLYVIVHARHDRVMAEVISGQADGCPAFHVEAPDEQTALRRLHGKYLDALTQNRIAKGEDARARARSCKVEVMDRQVYEAWVPKIIGIAGRDPG